MKSVQYTNDSFFNSEKKMGKTVLMVLGRDGLLKQFSDFYRTRVRSLVMLVTHSLTHSVAFSKLDVADVDAEDHIGNSLLQIWELTFGPEAKLLFRL